MAEKKMWSEKRWEGRYFLAGKHESLKSKLVVENDGLN